MFVMDRSAPITVDMVEQSVDGFAKLMSFRERVLKGNVCSLFSGEHDLAAKAADALRASKRPS